MDEQVYQDLQDKMQAEFENFTDRFIRNNPERAIDFADEYLLRESILYNFDNFRADGVINDSNVKALLNQDDVLEEMAERVKDTLEDAFTDLAENAIAEYAEYELDCDEELGDSEDYYGDDDMERVGENDFEL